MAKNFLILWIFGLGSLWADLAHSQELIKDRTGDGLIVITAFGDSITNGVGDTGLEGGYPGRLSSITGLVVDNEGVPGESAIDQGESRFPSSLFSTGGDVVVIQEGTNDAVFRSVSSEVRRALQRMVNVAGALGRAVVVNTLPVPCCEHGSLAPFVDAYNLSVFGLAEANEISVADIARTWRTTCISQDACELYNLPEGLHPNGTGYDALAQTVAATLFDIDIFSGSGASDLEGALGLPEGSVIVLPDNSGE